VTPLAVVASVGARTALGATAMHTGFLLRAGCAGLMAAPLVDAAEEPVTACFLQTLDPLLVGPARAAELAVGAMREALAPLAGVAPSLRIRLVLCVDEHLARKGPNGAAPPAASLLTTLQAQARAIAPSTGVEVIARGAAGPGFALAEAIGGLGVSYDALLLGGVHTDYDPEVIRALESAGRLYRDDHLDALIPGEAAAFALLTRGELARRHGLRACAQLHSFATAFEKATPANDESAFEATGLTVAVKKAGAPLLEARLRAGWILTDFTFELFRIYEWQSVSIRARQILGEPHHLDSPAQRIGHLGAAAMPLHMALAYEAWRRGYAPHAVALSLAGSDGGERAALVMSELPR
jgi:3-oxoacyl-[acyl-carrier-protein] synthase-1